MILTQCLIDWAVLEQSVIDDAMTSTAVSPACIRTPGHFNKYLLQHKLVKTFKLSLNLMSNKTFLSDYQITEIYVSQGNAAVGCIGTERY